MSLQENKDAIRNFWNEVFNSKNLELIDRLFTEDYVYHGAAGQDVHGREGLKQFLTMHFPICTQKLKTYSVKGTRY